MGGNSVPLNRPPSPVPNVNPPPFILGEAHPPLSVHLARYTDPPFLVIHFGLSLFPSFPSLSLVHSRFLPTRLVEPPPRLPMVSHFPFQSRSTKVAHQRTPKRLSQFFPAPAEYFCHVLCGLQGILRKIVMPLPPIGVFSFVPPDAKDFCHCPTCPPIACARTPH